MKTIRMGVFGACLFAALQGVCETETVAALSLTADTTVNVPAGVTQNVVRLMGGAYTLTKTGLGTLNIYWTSNENAKVVVEEGTFALRQYPKPTAVFAKAHFHVDASDPSTMVTECVNGTNFVVRWNDADGRTCYATNCPSTKIGRNNPQNRRAFLRSHFQNGLPVVDFGSLASKAYTNEQGVALGYGGAMEWSEPMVKTFREGFTVFSDTEDIYDAERAAIGGYPAAPFASFLYIANFRHELPGAQFYVNTTYSLPLGRGTNILDIVKFMGPSDAYGNKPGKGFHILNGITTSAYIGTSYDKYDVDAFAAERCTNNDEPSFGGQRIGEYAVFDDYLTEEERMEVSLYLKTKWFPRKFSWILVRDGATFDAGEGGVECADFMPEGSVNVGRAPVKVNPLTAYPAILHLDASAPDTLDTVNVGGTNFVRKWYDARGNGAYATNHFDDAHMPFLSPEVTLNGLSVVDFGSLRTPFNTNEVGEALGYGAAMALSSTLTPHEGITVVSDTPDITDGTWNDCEGFADMFGMSFFSRLGLGGEYYQARGKLRSDSAPYLLANSGNNNPIENGTNILDGVRITTPKSYAFPAGFHVIDMSPRTYGDHFRCTHLAAQKQTATPRNESYGGQRIAEYILFVPKLTETERDRVYKALRKKWFGEANLMACTSLVIPEGSAYEVKNEDLSVTGTLTLGGTLAAPSVTAARIVVDSADARVAAPLSLASDATLELRRRSDGSFSCLTADSVNAAGTCTVVLKAESWSGLRGRSFRIVNGAVQGGTWSAECGGGLAATLAVDAEGVTVTFVKGFSITIR